MKIIGEDVGGTYENFLLSSPFFYESKTVLKYRAKIKRVASLASTLTSLSIRAGGGTMVGDTSGRQRPAIKAGLMLRYRVGLQPWDKGDDCLLHSGYFCYKHGRSPLGPPSSSLLLLPQR